MCTTQLDRCDAPVSQRKGENGPLTSTKRFPAAAEHHHHLLLLQVIVVVVVVCINWKSCGHAPSFRRYSCGILDRRTEDYFLIYSSICTPSESDTDRFLVAFSYRTPNAAVSGQGKGFC